MGRAAIVEWDESCAAVFQYKKTNSQFLFYSIFNLKLFKIRDSANLLTAPISQRSVVHRSRPRTWVVIQCSNHEFQEKGERILCVPNFP
eukprot:SAG31_NODE_36375_length_314_cov_0.632558_1_plen_88_part_01